MAISYHKTMYKRMFGNVAENCAFSFRYSTLIIIKYKKNISLQHSVRATKSHIPNSTNHFCQIMW